MTAYHLDKRDAEVAADQDAEAAADRKAQARELIEQHKQARGAV